MQKTILFILLLLLFGCSGKKKKLDSKKLTKPEKELVAPPIEDTFLLRYHFKSGSTYNYKLTTISETSQELVTDSTLLFTTNQQVKYFIEITITSLSPENIATAKITVNSIKISGDVNGNGVTYDSKFIQSTHERMVFAQFEAIKKKSFFVDISNNGEVKNIYKTEPIFSELISIQELGKKLAPKEKEAIRKTFLSSSLQPLVEQLFRKFPKEKVGKTSTWNEKYYSQFAQFQIENTASFTLRDVEISKKDSIVNIDAGLSIKYVGNHTVSQNGIDFYFYDPVVSGNGSIKFDKTSGIILYSKTSTSMEMVTDISGVDSNKNEISAKRTDVTKNTNIIKLISSK